MSAPSRLCATALAVALAGCGGAGSGSSLLVYNGQHPQVTAELVSAFERESGVRVSVRTNDGIVLADQLLQEGEASPADVYLTENSPELMDLEQHGLLAKLDASTLAQIPRRLSSPGGRWVGVALRVSALAYDPAGVSAGSLPRSILELAQPRWRGRVALAATDSDFPPLVGAVIATYGRRAAVAWLAGLKRNGQLYQSEESVVSAVNEGSVAVGIVNHYYWYRLRLELGASAMHSRLYYFPARNVGTLENVSGAAVLKTSRHAAKAQAFVNFLTSAAAQRILAHGYDYEYPARQGVAANPQLTPLARVDPAALSPVALGNDQQAAQLVQESGLA